MAYPPFHPLSDAKPPTLTRAEFQAAFPTESEFVERKKGAGREPTCASVVSFSNTSGGVILIGVSDNGDVVGRDLTQGLEDDLHDMIGNVRDPGRYTIHPLSVDGTPITVVAVARRREGFAQTPDGRVLVRRGTRDTALFGSDLQRFLNERGLDHVDLTDTGIPLEEASQELLASIAVAFGWTDASSIRRRLQESGLGIETATGCNLTLAGALHLLDKPEDRLGKTYVEVLRYRDGGETYDRRVQIGGPLRDQVRMVTQLVGEEVGREIVVLGLQRHELPRLPERVLREAIANAVAHRSYELVGTAVRVEIRPDAVTIASPGSLPESVTVENMRDQASARNPSVIRVLRALNLAEELGLGVDVMQDVMRDELLEPPTFADTGSAVRVTLPVRSAVAPSERAWVHEVARKGMIEASDRILLVHAARGEVLTNARARQLLGVDRDDARSALQRLRDAGLLIQQGARGGSTYVLERSLEPQAGLRLGRAELEGLILDMAGEGEFSNADVRARTGLDRAQALDVLGRLVREGRLRRGGTRRGTRYSAAEPQPAAPSAAGLRMLGLIYDAFAASGEAPRFQYVSAELWQGAPRAVYHELSERGLVRPTVSPERDFLLREHTEVAVTLAGMAHIPQASDDMERLLAAVRFIGSLAVDFRPSSPAQVEQLTVTSETIGSHLGIDPEDIALARLGALIREETWPLHSGSSWQSAGPWSMTVNVEVARAYRDVRTVSQLVALRERGLRVE